MPDLGSRFYSDLAKGLVGAESPFQEKYGASNPRPCAFAEEVLGITLWEGQKKMLRSLAENKQTAVSSAPATGKTLAAAVGALWAFNCFPFSKTIVTASPPERQLKELLFAEIRRIQKECLRRGVPLVGGEPKALEIVADEGWWVRGQVIPSSGTRADKVAKFHGHHGRGGTFAFVDEAHAVPIEIMEAIDNCLSGGFVRLMVTSNPLAPSGPFFQAMRDKTFSSMTISAFEHPNVATGELHYPGMVDRPVTEERIQKYTRPVTPADASDDMSLVVVPWTGERRIIVSPVFYYKVLGEFPLVGDWALVSFENIQKAIQLWQVMVAEAMAQGHKMPVDLPDPIGGLDVAEMGSDANAFVLRYDNFLAPVKRWHGMKIPPTVDRACRLARAAGTVNVHVDAIGPGSGVAGFMRRQGVEALGVRVSWGATRETPEFSFEILKDQLAWSVREWFERDDTAIPPDEDLEADLLAYEYEVKRRGIRVTNKHEVRRRLLGRSSDSYDALALTFYEGRGSAGRHGVETMMMKRSSRGATRRPGRFPRRSYGRRR